MKIKTLHVILRLLVKFSDVSEESSAYVFRVFQSKESGLLDFEDWVSTANFLPLYTA